MHEDLNEFIFRLRKLQSNGSALTFMTGFPLADIFQRGMENMEDDYA